MKKKLISILAAGIILTNTALPVCASELTLTEGTQTATTPSAFNVPDDLVSDGVTVKIPASLDPTWNEAMGTFHVSDYVTAYGDLESTSELIVSVSKEITYTLNTTPEGEEFEDGVETIEDETEVLPEEEQEETEVTLNGVVKFGSEKSDTCTNTWNSTQLATGLTDIAQADSRPIIVNVSGTGIKEIGYYDAEVEFEITIGFLGLYNEINVPISKEKMGGYFHAQWNGSSVETYNVLSGYKDNSHYEVSANLANIYEYRSNKNLENLYLEMDTGSKVTTVKYLQMPDSDKVFLTSYWLESHDILYSWAMSFPNVEVLVLPHNVTYETLHTYFYNHPNSSNARVRTTGTYDFTNTMFNDTYTVIGNSLAFVKSVTADGYYIYIPHIVYRGTIEEWKALSGSTDWVFGNAANLVTVHCYDGELVY